jgi:hypothetical protein
MTSDYKYDCQMIAESLAEYDGYEFYKMNQNQQCEYYRRAMEHRNDVLFAAADRMRDQLEG